MRRLLILLFLLAVIAVVAPKGPEGSGAARAVEFDLVSDFWRQPEPGHAVQIPRGSNGGFAVQARINGIAAAMVVEHRGDFHPLRLTKPRQASAPPQVAPNSNVDVQTASGQTKAARWLDRVAIGKLVER